MNTFIPSRLCCLVLGGGQSGPHHHIESSNAPPPNVRSCHRGNRPTGTWRGRGRGPANAPPPIPPGTPERFIPPPGPCLPPPEVCPLSGSWFLPVLVPPSPAHPVTFWALSQTGRELENLQGGGEGIGREDTPRLSRGWGVGGGVSGEVSEFLNRGK